MKRSTVWLRFLMVPLLLAACVPASPPPPAAPVVTPEALRAELRQQLAELPGAVLSEEPALELSYPGEVLFFRGAVLPLPGGLELLEPLARAVAAHPDWHWRAVVRADTRVSPEYDIALARKRAELLGNFFRGRGLSPDRLEIFAEAGDDAPLQLSATAPDQVETAATSAGVKE